MELCRDGAERLTTADWSEEAAAQGRLATSVVDPALFRLHVFESDWVAPLLAAVPEAEQSSRGQTAPSFKRRSEVLFTYVLLAETEVWLSIGRRTGYFSDAELRSQIGPRPAISEYDWLTQTIRSGTESPRDVDVAVFARALWAAREDLTESRKELLRLVLFASDDEWLSRLDQLSEASRRVEGPLLPLLTPTEIDEIAWAVDGFGWDNDNDRTSGRPGWSFPESEAHTVSAVLDDFPAAWRTSCFALTVGRSASARSRLSTLNKVRADLAIAIERSAEAEDARSRGGGPLRPLSERPLLRQPEVSAAEPPGALTPALLIPSDFRFDAVHAGPDTPPASTPSLGPLAHFRGTFHGNGFGTIFRPDNSVTPTHLPASVGPSDNVLELNLTHETLSFSAGLGSVPNRGSVQGDAFLNGVAYLQTINDVTTGRPIGIHVEAGMWVIVPPGKDPLEGSTLVRMASIPHGTTINAQGTFKQQPGPPGIGKADITPFIEGSPGSRIPFPSQIASNQTTPRIPQDLRKFISNGTITQNILSDPNTVLRDAIQGLNVAETITITIDTAPSLPLFSGGTDNIAFLWGDAAAVRSANPSGQNAQSKRVTATFWIETVQRTVTVDSLKAGHTVTIQPPPTGERQPVPTFVIQSATEISAPTAIKVTYTQIQYSQRVILNFAGLSWPHVSVATLVPTAPILVNA